MAQNQHGSYIKHVKEHWESEKQFVNKKGTDNGNIFGDIVKTCIMKRQQDWTANSTYIWKPAYFRTKFWAQMITRNILAVLIYNQ